jgi:hypothetical protein
LPEEVSRDPEPIPIWLQLPPDAVPSDSGPVVTRLQELPFERLTWENFERLCVRLVQREGDVEHCQLYGTRGQDQQGIDIYARSHSGSGYRVYQCRRVERFGPASIRDAITDLLQGKWAKSADTFVLCTSHTTIATQYAEEIEKQAQRLGEHNVTFAVWDAAYLASRLKQEPRLVDDFFGRPYTVAFCGEEAAAALKQRLDARQVIEYRTKLRHLYRSIFAKHDPGIPVRAQLGGGDIPLAERYITPDVVVENVSRIAPPPEAAAERAAKDAEPSFATENRGATVKSGDGETRRYTAKMPIDAWLSQSDHSVILGVPGSGKSALLRFLALDLLSDAPSLQRVGARWSSLLPVWIPFAYWTKLVAAGPASSLTDCLRSWFHELDEDELWPLVERAMGDDRLLLLVDGWDEWASEQAGRIASQLLQVFVESRRVAALIVSRPYGFHRIPVHGLGWQLAEIAPLSDGQRKELCSKWISVHEARIEQPTMTAARASRAADETQKFIDEIERSSDLDELSRIPLLLLLLLYLHIEGATLPHRRFEAYEYLIGHLLKEHPVRKRTAAFLSDAPTGLTHDEVQLALAHLAFVVQYDYPSGIIPEPVILSTMESFLTDPTGLGLGLQARDARHYMHQFISVEEGTLGMLVRQGKSELSFFHRSLQEYLCAIHVSRMSLAQQQEIVRTRAIDPRWREVILGVFWRNRRPDDVATLLDSVDSSDEVPPDDLNRRELLAELAFGDFNLAPLKARELAEAACEQIEQETWTPHRRRLLAHALTGLASSKTRELVRGRIQRWVYATGWRAGWVSAIGNWPANDHTWSVLRRALNDEEANVQRAAAQAIAQVFGGEETMGRFIAAAASGSLDVYHRAAALESFIKGWPADGCLPDALRAARDSASPELRLVAISGHLARGEKLDDDLAELLAMTSGDRWGTPAYEWRGDLPEMLVSGWAGNDRLKQACLDGLVAHFGRGRYMDREIAEEVLLAGFPQDPDAVRFIVAELAKERPFLSMHGGAWRWLSKNFRDQPDVVTAIDRWALKQPNYQGVELSYVAPVGRTAIVKHKLIECLGGSFPHWATRALLDGWPADDEARGALRAKVEQPAERASEIAHLIPPILEDTDKSRSKLLELIRDPKCRRPDFVVMGFAALDNRGDEEEIVDACMAFVSQTPSRQDELYQVLIEHFPHMARVRDLAKRAIAERDTFVGVTAAAYAPDADMRVAIGELASPLPITLRGQIVAELARRPQNAFATTVLKQWDSERDPALKTSASIAFHTQLIQNRACNTEAVEQLANMTPCYGPDHESRRQAAFAGLVLLDRLDILREKRETIGFEGQIVTVPVRSEARRNLPFIDLVAEHWEGIQQAFGAENMVKRFTRPENPAEFWGTMAVVAARNPRLQAELLEVVFSNPQFATIPEVLQFLAAVRPKSPALLEQCIAALDTGDSWNWLERVETASGLLAQEFGADEAVLDRLLRNQPVAGLSSSRAIPLCLGWPEAPILERAYEQSKSNPGLYQAASFYLTYTKAPSDEFLDILREDLSVSCDDRFYARFVVRPVLARLKRDGALAAKLSKAIEEIVDVSLKATVPRLIAETRGVDESLLGWCRAEIARQTRSAFSEFGYDLLAQSIRSLTQSLLEVIYRSHASTVVLD